MHGKKLYTDFEGVLSRLEEVEGQMLAMQVYLSTQGRHLVKKDGKWVVMARQVDGSFTEPKALTEY